MLARSDYQLRGGRVQQDIVRHESCLRPCGARRPMAASETAIPSASVTCGFVKLLIAADSASEASASSAASARADAWIRGRLGGHGLAERVEQLGPRSTIRLSAEHAFLP